MTLLGFPLDSEQLGFHDDGYPRYSNEYDSADYRSLLTALVSDGIIAGYGDDFKVSFSDSAQKTNATAVLNIAKGASVLKGCFGIETDGDSIVVNAPTVDGPIGSQNTTHTLIGLRFKTRELTNLTSEDALYFIDTGDDGDPTFRDNALYLARVVSKTTRETGGAYSYQHTIEDLRASEHCGWSAPFAEIDTSAYYDAVQQIVDEANAEVENTIPALIENAQDNVGDAISELQEQTQVAVDMSQAAINETLAGQLQQQITDLQSKVEELEETGGGGCPFGVGMVITFIDDTNPNNLFAGTTWEKIEGKFLLSSSSSHAIGSTGGTETVTLSSSHIPSHKHSVGAHAHGLNSHTHGAGTLKASSAGSHQHDFSIGTWGTDWVVGHGAWSASSTMMDTYNSTTQSAGAHEHSITGTSGAASGNTANSAAFDSGATGGGESHENMPPYLVVNMWKRTA